MTDGQYLYCLANMSIDRDEKLAAMCPKCREAHEKEGCIVCGEPLAKEAVHVNPHFDNERFEKLKKGGAACE